MTPRVRYEVDLTDRVHHLVRVRVVLPAAVGSGARIALPTWTPGSYLVRNYARHVQWIRARTTDGSPLELEARGLGSWVLPSTAAGDVEVDLELYANELSVRTNHVDDQHALLVGAATFPFVDGADHLRHEVRLPPSPGTHEVFSLLPPADAPHTWIAENYDHLVDSAFEVGEHRSVRYTVDGVDHTFVWAGHGPGPDLDTVATEAAAIGEATVRLVGDGLPCPRYTFLCTAGDRGGGGLEHRDGAVLQVPAHTFGDEDRTARFATLLAHEYLHLFNGKRLVPRALADPDYERPTHSPSLWITEGWTSYYDELLVVRAGLWSIRRFLDHLSEELRRITDTPGVNLQSLRQSSHETWIKHYVRDENHPNAATDYYSHGALVAFELDLRLRRAVPEGDGLDDVLRLLWRRHGGPDARSEGFTEADVLDAVTTLGGPELAELVELRVGSPGPPRVDDGLLATVGLVLVDREQSPPPDLGVEVAESERGPEITAVLRDRPAWSAGVTGGDRIVALDGLVLGPGDLARALDTHRAGEVVELGLIRGPRLLRVPVTLGEPRPRRRLTVRRDAPDGARQAFQRWTGRPLPDA